MGVAPNQTEVEQLPITVQGVKTLVLGRYWFFS